MSVIHITDRIAATDDRNVLGKWGVIADRIASDPYLAEALRDVLLYHHYMRSSAPRLGIPSDQAHAIACFRDGWQQGLGAALDALTNHDYIREQRDIIQDRLNKEPENDADRA